MIKKIIKYVMVIIVMLLCITIITQKFILKKNVPDIFGYKSFIVVSSSMEPTLSIGDIVIAKETKDIKENDIISFKLNNAIITHRVNDIIKNDNEVKVITKGDANNAIDNDIILLNDIEGKYVFKISKLGNVILFLKTPQGLIILVALLGAIIAFNSFKDDKEKDKEE